MEPLEVPRPPTKLTSIYEPVATGLERVDVDIIFIHGFQGSHGQTWETPNFSWPNELPNDLPYSRVLTWKYEIVLRRDLSNSITMLAEKLLEDISSARSTVEAADRPIIFIAHSMGGLVVKSALDRPGVSSIAQCTKGICFFGTPHAGSNRETWLHAISAVKRALVSRDLDFASVSKLAMDTLEGDTLRDVSAAFRGIANRNSTQILTFFETKSTPTNRGKQMVVNKNTALVGTINEESIARNADHISIAKFSHRDDSGYRRVHQFIRRLIERTSNSHTLKGPVSNTTTFESLATTYLPQTELQLPEKEERFLEILRQDRLAEDMICDPHSNTCDWFLRCDAWRRWRPLEIHDPDRRMIWILGAQGMGKTVLAKYLGQELRKPSNCSPGWSPKYVLSYFFDQSAEARQTFDGLAQHLLHELLSHDRQLFKYLYGKPFFENGQLSRGAVTETLEIILQEQSLPEVAIIVDAFDECREQDYLRKFLNMLKDQPRIRTVVTAWPSTVSGPPPTSLIVDLDPATLPGQSEEQQQEVNVCISQYVKAEIKGVSHRHRRKLSGAFLQQLQECILKHEPQNFLWVRLAVRYVEIQTTPFLSRSAMKALPSSILGLLQNYLINTNSYHRTIIVHSLYIVMQAKAPLTVDSLSFLVAATLNENFLRMSSFTLSSFKENVIEDFEEEVQSLPLLEIRNGTVTLMHSSLKKCVEEVNGAEAFSNSPLFRNRTPVAESSNEFSRDVHLAMAELSVAYLIVAIEGRQDPLNFLNYAVLFWPDHIRDSASLKSDIPTNLQILIRQFFGDPQVFRRWCQEYSRLDGLRRRSVLPLTDIPDAANRIAFTLTAFDLCHVLGDAFLKDSTQCLISEDRGHTPIEFAIRNDCRDSVKWIQKLWEDTRHPLHSMATSDGRVEKCPLYLAVQYGTPEMVELLLTFHKTSSSGRPSALISALHKVAAERGRQDIFTILWDHHLIPTSPKDEALAALSSAVTLNCQKIADEIRKGHEQPMHLDDAAKNDLLHKAIRSGAQEILDRLIQDKSIIELEDRSGRLPLHTAAEVGNDTMVEKLLKSGARVNVLDNELQTPLHLACKAGWLRCCSKLLSEAENPARLNLTDNCGRIPAHYAAEFGHSDLLKTLLKWGSNLFASDSDGQTPLHLAAANGQDATVEILLDERADVNAQNARGRTALHEDITSGNVVIIWMLHNSGADITATDKDGATPLHLAAKGSSPRLIQELIRLGADPNCQDLLGKRPMDYLLKRHKPSYEVFRALKDNGAKVEGEFEQHPVARDWIATPKTASRASTFNSVVPDQSAIEKPGELEYDVDKPLPANLDEENLLSESTGESRLVFSMNE